MPKKLFLSIIFFLLFFTANSFGAPQYFTFEGDVNNIIDESGIISAAGYSIGSPVSYTIMVDFDADGYILQPDGSMDILNDRYGDSPYEDNYLDYFYAEFISGTLVNSYDVPVDAAVSYFGVEEEYGQAWINDFPYSASVDTDFNFFTDYDFLGIGGALFIEDLTEGSSLVGWQYAYNGDSSLNRMESNLTLMDISDTNPVPIPGAVWLLGSGLVGLFTVRRRKV